MLRTFSYKTDISRATPAVSSTVLTQVQIETATSNHLHISNCKSSGTTGKDYSANFAKPVKEILRAAASHGQHYNCHSATP